MRFSGKAACILLLALLTTPGCLSRPPSNVFPGTKDYATRVKTLKITPDQAYRIAYEQASADGQLHYISRQPTVLAKHWYVFSVPLPSGANLQGYHVNGDNGEVKFISEKKIVSHTVRE